MPANFNNSAWFYDRLSRVVYGRALINAQRFLLQYIPANANVLIVGGGTGWILEEIAKIHPSGLAITYVEIAEKMMLLSKKQYAGDNQVVFINEAVENADLKTSFDIVITPFLLDNFTEAGLQKIFNSMHRLLRPGGRWLNSSFQLTGKWWQAVLLKSMFLFFRIVCGVEASKLPGIESQFNRRAYRLLKQQTFFNEFVLSTVYEKDQINKA